MRMARAKLDPFKSDSSCRHWLHTQHHETEALPPESFRLAALLISLGSCVRLPDKLANPSAVVPHCNRVCLTSSTLRVTRAGC